MIQYADSLEGIVAGDLQGFFVGWPNPPSPETHLKLLAGSDHIVLAIDDETGATWSALSPLSPTASS